MEVLVVGADLEVHQHDPRVLHGVLDCPKEGDGLATVHQAVVVSEGNVHHRPDHHLQYKLLMTVHCILYHRKRLWE